MTSKTDFTAEEWKELLQAIGIAGIYTMISDPRFMISSMKEAFTVSSNILEKETGNNNELLAALVADCKKREITNRARLKLERKDLSTIKQEASASLRQAAKMLDKKLTTEESAEIKVWLSDMSVRAASAAKEGRFPIY